MTGVNLRSFEVCLGVGMALSGEISADVLEVIIGDREAAEEEAWRLQCEKRVRQTTESIPAPKPFG